MHSLKLTYFDSPGRAEPIRIALFLADAAFEDCRLKFPEFMAAKADGQFPLGSVPVLHVDGVPVTQTASMLRFAAKLGGGALYPTDAYEALRVDSVIDTFNDTLTHALVPSFMERDMAKKLEMRAVFVAGPMKLVFDYTEGLLTQFGGPFIGGARLTIADLVVGQQLLAIQKGVLDGVAAEVLEPYPRLRALADAYVAHPSISAYFSK